MKVAQDIARGLEKIYHDTGKTVWVYRARDGQVAFDALVDGQEPDDEHRQRDRFWLEGQLDYASGSVIPFYDEDEEEDEVPVRRIDWWGVLDRFGKVLLGICIAAVIFILALASAVSGGKGGRSR